MMDSKELRRLCEQVISHHSKINWDTPFDKIAAETLRLLDENAAMRVVVEAARLWPTIKNLREAIVNLDKLGERT